VIYPIGEARQVSWPALDAILPSEIIALRLREKLAGPQSCRRSSRRFADAAFRSAGRIRVKGARVKFSDVVWE